MDKEDVRALNRARVMAGWSYLGIIVPLLGWILGGISLSNLSSIETPDMTKAKRRIKSVKKMALGGIVLSTVLALAYSGATFASIRYNDQLHKQALQAKLASDEKGCEEQVIAFNNKILGLNSQYTSLLQSPFSISFDNLSNAQSCKKNTTNAISEAKTNYKDAIAAANKRCLAVADDTYNNNLKINAISSYKDASGQIIYSLSQASSARVQQSYQNDKDTCNAQLPVVL